MTPFKKRRKHKRFSPELNTVAYVSSNKEPTEFTPDYTALIKDDSPMGGCCLVTLSALELKPHELCVVKLGELKPVKAEVVWKKDLDKDVVSYGLKFVE